MPVWKGFIDWLGQDVCHAIKQFVSKPMFTAVAVASTALGIGATTAIFSIVHAILMDPFPYRSSERIGNLWLVDQRGQTQGLSYTPGQYLEIRHRTRVMEDIVAFRTSTSVLTEPGFPQIITQDECSRNLFDFFGVPPLLGREFSVHEENSHGSETSVAVLSYAFWQRTFQGRRDILGQQLQVNHRLYAVVGVLPVRFTWSDADMYTPMEIRPGGTDLINVLYRMRPDVSQSQIENEFVPLLLEFRKQVPRWLYPEGAFHIEFVNIRDAVVGKFENTLLVLFAAVTLLLLIACSNVANLLLSRASARQAEMAVRVCLGASRWRLLQQLLTESAVLGLAGGAAGVLLAHWGNTAAVALLPPSLFPHEAAITLNGKVLSFAVMMSLVASFAFGLFPALQLSNRTHLEALRAAGKGSGIGRSSFRLHYLLIVVEISLSFTLLTGTASALRALATIQHVNLGYDPLNVLTFFVPLEQGRFTQWASRQAYFREILDRVRRLPGVQSVSASAIGTPPFNGGGPTTLILDRPTSAGQQAAQISWNLVSGDYFKTVRTPLLRGRDFQASDILRADRVAVITEDLARSYFPGQDPLGRRFQLDLFNQPIPPAWLNAPHFNNFFEIVGVVAAARNRGPGAPPQPAVFLPYSVLSPPGIFVCVKTQSDFSNLLGRVRHVMRELDPGQPITQTSSLEQSLRTAGASPRFTTFLFGVLGGIGMVLAAVGVFGVTNWTTAQRTREFGIRIALGALPNGVLRLALKSMSQSVLAGVLVGLGLSVTFSVLSNGRVEGMGTLDPLTLAAVPLILAGTAVLASLGPALSATRVEPMDALRHE